MRYCVLLLISAVLSWSALGYGDELEKVIRLGTIGLDTSHVIAFTSHLNNPKNNSGCRVVAGFPGRSTTLHFTSTVFTRCRLPR